MEAKRRGMGVIAMKVMSRGVLTLEIPASKLLHYAMDKSDVAIVGCSNESDVRKNIIATSEFTGSGNIIISDEIREKARYFCKDSKKQPWPSTYQPNWPRLNYQGR